MKNQMNMKEQNLDIQAVAALTAITDILWRDLHIAKHLEDGRLNELGRAMVRADIVLRRIRATQVRPAVLDALHRVNPYIIISSEYRIMNRE